MTSVNPTLSGATPPTTQILVGASDPKAKTQMASFDPLAFVDGSGDGVSNPRAGTLLMLGMQAPSDRQAGASHGDSDLQPLSAAADRPFNLAEVSAMFLEFMLSYRQAARLDRQSSLEGQMKELLGSAQKTRDAAQANFSAALAQGIASIVGGAIQGAIGAVQFKVMSSMKQTMNAKTSDAELKSPVLEVEGPGAGGKSGSVSNHTSVSLAPEGARSSARASGPANQHYLDEIESSGLSKGTPSKTAKVPDSLTSQQQNQKFDYLSSRSRLLGEISRSGAGLLAEGPAKVVQAVYTGEAGVAQAESQEHEANAKKAEAAYSASSDEAQTAREAFNKVLDMVAEIDRSRSETSKSIARI